MKTRRWSLSAAVAIGVAAAAAPTTAGAARPPPVRVSAKALRALSAKPATTTVTVTNVSRRRLSGLTVSVTAPKGVTATVGGARRGRASRALPVLKAGRTARVGVSVRRTGRAPARGRLLVKVTRRGKAVASTRVAFGRPAAPPRAAPPRSPPSTPTAPPTPPPNTLAGRYFWGSLYTINGIQQYTLYFTGDTLVDTAPTESAWPVCTAPSETCKAYSYDARTNQLTIDGKPATLASRTLTFDDQAHFELGFPPAGARWDTTVTYSNSSGICPLYCSYYTEYLTFLPDGTFARDAVASGSGPIVDWAAIPPDSKGTYEVRPDHTLRLAFADGRERIETVALMLDDDGSLKAPGEGIVLGGDGYFDIRD